MQHSRFSTLAGIAGVLYLAGCGDRVREISAASGDRKVDSLAVSASASKGLLQNAIWKLRGEENSSFQATQHAFIYFEHPDTVPYEIVSDTLFLFYSKGLITKDRIIYLTRDSFSLIGETGDVILFDRISE